MARHALAVTGADLCAPAADIAARVAALCRVAG